MKINWKVRCKNPYFWVGIMGTILTAMGVSAETFTTWQAVADQLKALVSNPFMLGSVLIALFGIVYDPTTVSIGDSQRVLAYRRPDGEEITEEKTDL